MADLAHGDMISPAWVVPGVVAAAWLHELTHLACASALGCDVVEIDLWNLHVDFRGSGWRRQAVLQAPAVIGLVLAVPLFWTQSTDIQGLILAVCWWVYALQGGQGEFGVLTLAGVFRQSETSQ